MSKIQIRRGLFETNSSSVHSIVMCSESDFDKWKNGEYVYSKFDGKLVSINDDLYQKWLNTEESSRLDYEYLTYDDFFNNWDAIQYETYKDSYKSPSGDVVVAFGYYGSN